MSTTVLYLKRANRINNGNSASIQKIIDNHPNQAITIYATQTGSGQEHFCVSTRCDLKIGQQLPYWFETGYGLRKPNTGAELTLVQNIIKIDDTGTIQSKANDIGFIRGRKTFLMTRYSR